MLGRNGFAAALALAAGAVALTSARGDPPPPAGGNTATIQAGDGGILYAPVSGLSKLARGADGKETTEVRARVKKADADKGVLTVAFPGAPGSAIVPDQDFAIDKDTKIVDVGGNDLKDGLKAKFFEKPGGMVTITTEKKDDKSVVTRVKAWVDPEKEKDK